MPAKVEKGLIADRPLWVKRDARTVVEEGDPEAVFQLASKGAAVPPGIVAEYNLAMTRGKVQQKSNAGPRSSSPDKPPKKAARKKGSK